MIKKAYNDSHRSDKDLQPLVDFVCERTSNSRLAVLLVYTNEIRGGGTIGMAHKHDTDTMLCDGVPGLVTVGVSKDKCYPWASEYRKSVGPVRFESWQEEFLFVLAHEFRHIDQFWMLNPPRHYEVDAEHFAMGILAEYRDSKPTRYKQSATTRQGLAMAARRPRKAKKK